MATQWYYARDGSKFGPFSVAQLKQLVATRQLRPQDTVWKEGVEKGVPGAKVEHLFPDARAHPSPAGGGGQAAPVPPTAAAPAQGPSPQPPVSAAEAAPPPGPPPAPATPLAARLAMPEDLELAAGQTVWAPPAPDDGPGEEPPPAASQPTGPAPGRQPLPGEPDAAPEQQKVRKRRVLGVKGGVIQSQDGLVLRYRKKCLRCGYTDTSLATMAIRSGVTRGTFFCPKCKKSQQVEVQAVNT